RVRAGQAHDEPRVGGGERVGREGHPRGGPRGAPAPPAPNLPPRRRVERAPEGRNGRRRHGGVRGRGPVDRGRAGADLQDRHGRPPGRGGGGQGQDGAEGGCG
ncbi:hypothetical protein THAOC_23108, partial [Thalassiosira oceanica]